MAKEDWMASDLNFVEFVCDQIAGAGRVSFRKMFGEYAIYCNEKVVALVCRNQLFVRPTAGGHAKIGRAVEAPPYPGAKPHFLIGEQLEDRLWMSDLIQITVSEIPVPRPKRPKPRKAKR